MLRRSVFAKSCIRTCRKDTDQWCFMHPDDSALTSHISHVTCWVSWDYTVPELANMNVGHCMCCHGKQRDYAMPYAMLCHAMPRCAGQHMSSSHSCHRQKPPTGIDRCSIAVVHWNQGPDGAQEKSSNAAGGWTDDNQQSTDFYPAERRINSFIHSLFKCNIIEGLACGCAT